MEGISGAGALMLMVNPRSSTALLVELPNTAMRVSFCLKSGKFSYKE